MSEKIIDQSDNLPPSPVHNYRAVHPSVEAIDAVQLKAWCEEAEGIKDPNDLYHVGWMWGEQGLEILRNNTATTDEADTLVLAQSSACFSKAEQTFRAVVDMPHANRMIKARATIAEACVVLHYYSSLGVRPEGNDLHGWMNNLGRIVAKTTAPLLNPRFEKSPQDSTFLNTLTAMQLINSNPNRTCIALPAPSRFSESEHSSDSAWNLVLWDFADSNRLYRARVGSRQAAEYVTIPTEILGNEAYATRHNFGTLQAITDLPRRPAAVHIKHTMDNLSTHLNAEFEDMLHNERERPHNLSEWHAHLPPEATPYLINKEYTDGAIARLESAYLGGELDPYRTLTLGWMLVERAKGRDEKGENVLAVSDLNTAAEVFRRVSHSKWENYADQPLGLLRYEASVARETALLQKAIVDHDPNLQKRINTYKHSMAHIGGRVIGLYESLYNQLVSHGQDETEATNTLHDLLYTLTMSIAAADDEYGDFLAFPCSPRQRGNIEKTGWHITVLRQNDQNAFSLHRYGQMRLVTEAVGSPEALLKTRNILAMCPDDFGHKSGESYATLWDVIRKVQNPESLTPQEQTSIRKLRIKLSQSTSNIGLL